MKYIQSAIFLLLTLYSFSQTNVVWGEFEEQKASLGQILPLNESEFFAINSLPIPPLNIDSMITLNFYENLKKISSGDIQLKIKEKQTKLEGIKLIKGEIHVFLSIIQGDEKILYLQKYSKNCLKTGELVELTKYLIPNKLMRKGDFNIVVSENKAFVGIIAEIPGTKKENDKIIHSVYTDNFDLLSKGENFLSYPSEKIKIFQSYLTNEGKLFLVSKYFKYSKAIKLNTDEQLVDKIILNELDVDKILSIEFSVDSSIYITSFKFIESKNRLELTGVFSYLKNGNSEGFFNLSYDLLNKSTSTKFTAFKFDKLKSLWNRLLSSEEKIQFIYQIKDAYFIDGGSRILTFEQCYQRIDQADMNGSVGSISYFYNDVLVFKLSASNMVLWESKIDKYQKSKNDGGPFSSFNSFISGNKLIFSFNDNFGNYDMHGEFFQCQSGTDFTNGTNVIAQAEIDLFTGLQNRKIVAKKNEMQSMLAPRKSTSVRNFNQIFLHSKVGLNQKFGILKY